MHAPPEVQHWAEMNLPSGAATASESEAMQTPRDTTSESPLRASTPRWSGGGVGVPAVGADVGAGV